MPLMQTLNCLQGNPASMAAAAACVVQIIRKEAGKTGGGSMNAVHRTVSCLRSALVSHLQALQGVACPWARERRAPVGLPRREVVRGEVGAPPGRAIVRALLVHEHDVAVVDRVQLQVRHPPGAGERTYQAWRMPRLHLAPSSVHAS
jgi:hypothetical protein